MTWKIETQVEQRKRFIDLQQSEDSPGIAALCREFGICRSTAYKWMTRYSVLGDEGLQDQSKAPKSHPNAISLEIEQLVISARQLHPSWGAKKLLPWLEKKHPGRDDWPCLGSVSAILERNQLVRSNKKRRLVSRYKSTLSNPSGPNGLWCIDHKGWWLANDGNKCEPFTVTDNYSRFLVRCVLCPNKGLEFTRAVLTTAFHEYGLPEVIRSDNGAPFASRAPLGLSALSVWFMRLGILHERIDPGKPQQNGSHERMHGTMERDRTQPIGATVRQEQKRLNGWRDEFNHERPHEALNLQTPGSIYTVSPREMPIRLPDLEYGSAMRVRKVDICGKIVWQGLPLFLTEALRGQVLGFEATNEDKIWQVWLSQMLLGTFNEKRHEMKWATKMTNRMG